MRILFTMTGSWGTGSGTVVEAVTAELHERGHETLVLHPSAPGFDERRDGAEAWPFPIRNDDAELETFPLMIPDPNPENLPDAPTYRTISDAQLQLFLDAYTEKLRTTVQDFQPDLLECQHVWAMPYVAAKLDLPYIAVAHHSDQMGFRFDPRMQPYAREAAQNARYVFAISESVRANVLDLYGLPPERVVTIGNGYDQDVFTPRAVDRAALLAAHDLTIPDDAPIITFAGKLSKTKGVDILLEANRVLQAARADAGEPPAHLILFGTGNLEDVLDANRDAYSLDHVHLLGHQPYTTVRDFHNVARFSVIPSRTEGFGIAGLEAMGCGLPLIATRSGGPETFAVGHVVEPEDVDALTDAMLDLLRQPDDVYRALREEAHARAREFSWGAIAEQRIAMYERALAGPAL